MGLQGASWLRVWDSRLQGGEGLGTGVDSGVAFGRLWSTL